MPLDVARQTLHELTRRGQGGRDALARFAWDVDVFIRDLVANAPRTSCRVAVLALGGYGRRHLCPYSDLDVLFLFDGPLGRDEEKFLTAVLHPLWDLGLVIGHQVREVGELAAPDTTDATFLLALLDARLVHGDAELMAPVSAVLAMTAVRQSVSRSLEHLIDERHASFMDTLYQLEPDVKDAPGTLRDLSAIRAIARVTDPALLQQGPVADAALEEVEEFLLRIRSVLHFESRRNQNVLSHELQERVAPVLGYADGTPRQQVEHLMGDYFRHARSVTRALAWIRETAPVPVGPNLARWRDGIRFVDLHRAKREPASWLSVFQTASDLGVPLAEDTLALFQRHGGRFNAEAYFPTPASREALFAFLKPQAGLYARLSEMHDCGLLVRMFPEFDRITCRVVRDFYHKYTVDEHTLLTIRNLERLVTHPAGRERFASLLAEVVAPELLVLSLIYHDVGKWRDDDHCGESVVQARQMAERLELPAEAWASVEFLIEHHTKMSLAAFRRDTEDPEVVRAVADLVGTEDQLKMLTLLTLADVAAVSPETMTPWREELLWRLYIDTYNQLTLGYGDEVIGRGESDLADLLTLRPIGLSESEVRRFVEGLPRRYLRLFSPEAIFHHVQLSRDIQPDHVHATLERRGAAWEVTVVSLDKPFLFSNVCGVLSSYGMDILRGHAMTNPVGLVLDTFQFVDRERFLELNEDGADLVTRALEAAVAGELDVVARLRVRERSVLTRRSAVQALTPVIHSDNRASQRYTILDITARNAVGLLHRISRVISQHDCGVDLVLISTEGEKAIDVFHITQRGAKLSPDAEQALTADLTRMLEGYDEVD